MQEVQQLLGAGDASSRRSVCRHGLLHLFIEAAPLAVPGCYVSGHGGAMLRGELSLDVPQQGVVACLHYAEVLLIQVVEVFAQRLGLHGEAGEPPLRPRWRPFFEGRWWGRSS